MNRSILIVICDFLLVSLLIFSTPDLHQLNHKDARTKNKPAMVPARSDEGKDLATVMKRALEQERANRDKLLAELAQAREAASGQQALANQRQQQAQAFQQKLAAHEQQNRKLQQELASRDQQARQLQQQLAARNNEAQKLAQQQAALQKAIDAAQARAATLAQQLHHQSNETVISKEKLAALEAEAQKRQQEAAALKQRLSGLEQTNQVILAQKQQLTTQLQVAQVEKKNAAQQAAHMQGLVQVERQEKAKLMDDVKTLATHSGDLAKEIKDNRPLAPNTIFSEFLTNRVQASFNATRPGLFGHLTTKHRQAETILVSDGTNDFALCHVEDTPLTFWSPGTDWTGLTGTLGNQSAAVPIHSASFCWPDPRVIMIPLTSAEAQKLHAKIYHLSPNPFQFQDVVVVGTQEGYYGECKFEIDLSTPGYVKLDRNFIKGLFGKFNPSRGDLVFTRTGQLLGIMANGTYCLMIQKFQTAATLQFGPDIRSEHTGDTLSELYSFVTELPAPLQ